MSAMSTASTPAAGTVYSRVNFAFSPEGREAACIRTSEGHYALEAWSFDGHHARSRVVGDVAGIGPGTRALPLGDGRFLVLPNSAETPELLLLDLRTDPTSIHSLGEMRALGGYLLPSPSGPSPAQLGFLVSRDDVEHSTIRRVTASPPGTEELVRLPGAASGGVWLDRGASMLAVNLAYGSRPSSGVAVDLSDRSWTRWFSVSAASTDRVVLYSPRSGLLVVSTNAFGEPQVGLTTLGSGEPVRFPERLYLPGYGREALAVDEPGERLLVHWEQGAVSRLGVYTPADDRLEPLNAPAGAAQPDAARWSGEVIRLPFSTPAHPPTVLTASPERGGGWSLADTEGARRPARVGADLVELQGAAGPLEAITYGPDWRFSEHLVLALHGGPLSHWHYEFHPLLHALAAGGIPVVALNYRGSTGYGRAHMEAAFGAWGGPDLDDVAHVARELGDARVARGARRPVVLGVSYGAFLALLAAGRSPHLWSGCVAVAPFLSGPWLHESAPPWVARRLEHLGALEAADGAVGHRDVLRVCSEISAPLLLLHGTGDEAIPAEQTRLLRRRLLELGRVEEADFVHRELPWGHEEVTRGERRRVRDIVVDFCRAGAAATGSPSPSKGAGSSSGSVRRSATSPHVHGHHRQITGDGHAVASVPRLRGGPWRELAPAPGTSQRRSEQ